MSHRSSVRLGIAVAAALLALVGCGGGADEPSAAASASTPTASSSEPEATPTASVGPTTMSPDVVAACAEFDAVIADITSGFPDGVGLSPGAVPGDDQVAAVTALIQGFRGVEVLDEPLAQLRDSLVLAAQTILVRAAAGAPLTDADSGAFTAALVQVGTVCGAS
jgi:hypothetical protein